MSAGYDRHAQSLVTRVGSGPGKERPETVNGNEVDDYTGTQSRGISTNNNNCVFDCLQKIVVVSNL